MTSSALTLPGIEDLYARYSPMVLRRARTFLDGDEAQDMVHEVFMRVIEHIEGFRGAASPSTWLYRITTHLCLNHLRDDTRRKRLLSRHYEAVPGSSGSAADPAGLAVLAELWRTLDDDLAQVAVYYHVDGMTHEDVAAILGCSAATVRNRLKAIEQHARLAGGAP